MYTSVYGVWIAYYSLTSHALFASHIICAELKLISWYMCVKGLKDGFFTLIPDINEVKIESLLLEWA